MSQGKCLILGFGSDALSDDGLPVRLIQDLKLDLDPVKFDFETSPLGGLELIELLQGYSDAVLIDTQITGKRRPGDVSIFTPEHFEETFHLSSQHDLSFENVLKLAKEINIPFPAEIKIIAIEVVENKQLGFEFSDEIKELYSFLLSKIKSHIA